MEKDREGEREQQNKLCLYIYLQHHHIDFVNPELSPKL